MKNVSILLLSGIMTGFISCSQDGEKQLKDVDKIIEQQTITLKSNIMTPEVLWSFGRVSEVEVSPDKKKVLYGATFYSIAQNKGNRELYTMNIDGSDLKRITNTKFSEYQATWSSDGKKVDFLSAETGSMQLWEMDTDGNNRKQITNIENGIDGYKFSPGNNKLVYSAEVFPDKKMKELYEDLPKASGRIYNDHMYRHWDTWIESYSHLFLAEVSKDQLTGGKDILGNEPFECPMKPFGGMEQVCWSPDGKIIAYTCRKKKGVEYTKSTNSDIYLYEVGTGNTSNLTEGMMGYDINPVFSPDGKKIAWQSMERDGYESDKNRLFIYDSETKTRTDYSKDFDQNSENLVWSEDGKLIYFISDWHATDEIYKLDPGNNKISRITDGIHNYTSVIPAGERLIATRVSMSKPAEIYSVDPLSGKDSRLSDVNTALLDQLTMGKVEKRWIKTSDNKEMLTWIIYPPDFDPAKKYPALLYCEGGPQSTVSQFWS